MECALSWQYNALINELSKGKENAKQLRFHLYSTYPSEAHDLILQKILSSYDKALMILKLGGLSAPAIPTSGATESSVSVDGSLEREDSNKNVREHQDYVNASKKRKMQPTWTEQVKANSENGLEGPADDGFSWRKYGQKYIMGTKYPRSYYRCTYRLVQNCWATKQVQRSDDDLTLFDITYKGKHTCNQSAHAVPLAASPEKQELRMLHNADGFQLQNQMLSNLSSSLRIDTEGLGDEETSTQISFLSTFGCHDMDNNSFPIPSLVDGEHQQSRFQSPATSGSDCFQASTYPMKSWGEAPFQHPELDTTERVSAHASEINSPIGGMEFIVDPVDLDPDFPFDTSEFFSYSNFEC